MARIMVEVGDIGKVMTDSPRREVEHVRKLIRRVIAGCGVTVKTHHEQVVDYVLNLVAEGKLAPNEVVIRVWTRGDPVPVDLKPDRHGTPPDFDRDEIWGGGIEREDSSIVEL
jgi:hypothetical protein